MKLEIKKYRDNVKRCLIEKYHLTDSLAENIIQESYLKEALIRFPNETIHNDIETTAIEIYEQYNLICI